VTITDTPPTAALTPPGASPPDAVSGAPQRVSGTAASVSQPGSGAKRNPQNGDTDAAGGTMLGPLMVILSALAAVGGIMVGIIGFAMSYTTLSTVALTWGFTPGLAPWFPVGVDASIVAFLALDLYLVRKGTGWPVLRLAAHGMTAATIWFNASSQGKVLADPVKSAAHGVMPLLFVIGVEAARRLLIHKARLEAGAESDRIPLSRWLLAPITTARLFRRMKLHDISSYPEMVTRQQELIGYKQWLKRKHGGDLSKASDDELLPMTMAPYGYTVAQALALPDQQQREAEARAEEAERRRLEAETRRQQAADRAEADRLRSQGDLEAVRATVAGETEQARARARAVATAAERAAELEAEALESAEAAEAKARAARADQAAAEARKAAAETDAAAAETERAAAETRRRTAEEDAARVAAEARRAAELERIEQAQVRAAQAQKEAAEIRAAVAEIERRAVEAEDRAKLTPRERAVRKVARMILNQARGVADQLPLADIQRELAVSSPATASQYRAEASDLLASGYRL
jgi:hypothetical protein